ncbi:bifunctional riboflavin kinase/FAD synthetase [Aquibium sp. A9E412]|uniref:bifunctional riboflavin kinase/FAD synthetase n=1 Tax=Aquibium sp. A9E412 TaxID=2976767 RepID=UPI0025AF47CF|nr:bifunctional riboflavin kinase/FAD synthetase [Aquibium sp. A9E412]MDN2566257.1 bifunctional riboflavin kinase/FAD synthetase [Aquibium sp. A9E412]
MSEFARIAGAAGLPETLRGGVVAVGNFDGVHRGHRAVLDEALAIAGGRGLPALVLTFEPHPRSVFAPHVPLFRLTPAPAKARLLAALGFDAVVEQPFDRAFAALEPEAFVRDVLVGGLGIAHAVTGYDFHYGRERGGGPAELAAAGRAHGFGVSLAEAFCDEGGAVISSTRIRGCLAEGDAAGAAGLLGYRYTVAATVAAGRRLGRTLGYPTANMALAPETALRHGIYAVRLRRADGSLHDGVASFGRRPTVEDDGRPLLETFLFDFSGDLYGETCTVSLFGFLRGEEKFDDLEALTAQMRIDEAEARALLSDVRPLSALDARICFAG